MEEKKTIVNNQKGMVLVLALYMMALLSMIGVAAKMTSTTEIEIAGNEKFKTMAFYESETGLTVAAEVADTTSYNLIPTKSSSFYDDNKTILILNTGVMQETKDVKASTGAWDKDNQTNWVRLKDPGTPPHPIFPVISSDSQPDIVIGKFDDYKDLKFTMFIDIDKVDEAPVFGSGDEWGAAYSGVADSARRFIYNIDCIGTLPGGRSRENHVLGYQLLNNSGRQ